MKRLPTRQEELLTLSTRGALSPIWEGTDGEKVAYYKCANGRVTASIRSLLRRGYVVVGPWDRQYGLRRVMATSEGLKYLEVSR